MEGEEKRERREAGLAAVATTSGGMNRPTCEIVLVVMAAVSPAALAARLASRRQGTGEIGSGSKADQLLVVCCPCLPLELFLCFVF